MDCIIIAVTDSPLCYAYGSSTLPPDIYPKKNANDVV